jgi:hypothetical protein
MEAEYIALSEAAKEAKFLCHLLSTITTPATGATVINTDSIYVELAPSTLTQGTTSIATFTLLVKST